MRECARRVGWERHSLTLASPGPGTYQGHQHLLHEMHTADKYMVMHIIKFPRSHLLCAENLSGFWQLRQESSPTPAPLPEFTAEQILVFLQLPLTSE